MVLSITKRSTMSEKKHQVGSMDKKDQVQTFNRFISFGLYLFCASIAAIIFLAIFNS